eukprot:7376372-Prymnesium_polylepis.1
MRPCERALGTRAAVCYLARVVAKDVFELVDPAVRLPARSQPREVVGLDGEEAAAAVCLSCRLVLDQALHGAAHPAVTQAVAERFSAGVGDNQGAALAPLRHLLHHAAKQRAEAHRLV